jgi:uncharacterized protein
MPLFLVSAHDIDAAGLALDAELPPAWLEQELADASVTARPGAPARLTARLSRSGKDIVVRGRVVAGLSTPCARCTEPATVDVDTELSLLLQPSAERRVPKKDEEYEFSAAEADVDTYDGEVVVLDPFVREALLLEVPNFPLCSEGCPGIGPAAEPPPGEAGGAARPLDPRLAPLGALRAKLDGSAERAVPVPAAPQTKKKE